MGTSQMSSQVRYSRKKKTFYKFYLKKFIQKFYKKKNMATQRETQREIVRESEREVACISCILYIIHLSLSTALLQLHTVEGLGNVMTFEDTKHLHRVCWCLINNCHLFVKLLLHDFFPPNSYEYIHMHV